MKLVFIFILLQLITTVKACTKNENCCTKLFGSCCCVDQNRREIYVDLKNIHGMPYVPKSWDCRGCSFGWRC